MHLFCSSSFIAGLAGAVASNPIDVVKTRMMNQRNLKAPGSIAVGGNAAAVPAVYSGSLDCLVTVRKVRDCLVKDREASSQLLQ